MADNVLVPIVVAAIGLAAAVVTGVIGYRSARWNARKDLEIELRRQRLRALKKLWALSEPLGLHYRSASVTAASMRQLSAALQRWYFHEGGMFLSDESREAYVAFQLALRDATEVAEDDKELDAETFRRLWEMGSGLRETLRASFQGFPKM
jgi:hypothetical protein